MYLSVALALLILLASHGGYAYPTGPPTSICNTSPEMFLRPGASHGNPQSGNGGFLISTDLPVSAGNNGGYNYEAGELYTVLINDTTAPTVNPGFRGFVVQAQSVPGGNLIGAFLVNTAEFQQNLDCRDSMGNMAMATVTHSNGGRQNFMDQRILWRAPPEMNGTVEFRYSVVRRMPTYYSNLQASENRGEVLPETTEPTSPPLTTARPTGPAFFELSVPPGCTHGSGDCDRSVRFFRSSETQYTFDLEGNGGGWVAVGFSQTQDMYSTDVFACTADDMMVEVLDTWNIAGSRENERDGTQADIRKKEARIINGRITCKFTRTIDGENPGRDIRLQDELFVMVGTSSNRLSPNSPGLQTHVGGGGVANPNVSPSPINISSPIMPPVTSPRPTSGPTSGPAMFELRTPPDCTHGSGDCVGSVRFFRSSETQYTFDLEGGVRGGRETGWVAVGFSKTRFMSSTDVFACGTANGTTVEVLDTWNANGSRQNLRDDTQGDIQMEEARIMNGRITCRFTRTIDGDNPGRDIRLQDELYVMVGISMNRLSNSSLRTHVGGGVANPFVSPSPINISSTPVITVISQVKGALVRAHGILMLIAWPLLTTVAIFFAGYMKCALPNGEWFQVHRALNLASLCLSLIAFILIFVSQYQNRIPGLIELSKSNSTGIVHFSFGIIITFLQILNPILAIFRCKPDSKNRWIFNTFHGYIAGYIAQGLSWATVSLGLALFTSGYSSTFGRSKVPLWIFVGFCGFVLLYHIVMITMSVVYWKKKNKCGSEDCKGGKCDHGKCSFNKEKGEVEMKQPTVVTDDKKPLDEEEKKKPPSDSWWLWVGAGVYIGTTLVVVVVVIILVALD